MSSKTLFTLEEDTILAEFVSKHPCLFDLRNSLYKDQHVRENVWKEVSCILKTKSVDDCKKRWRNMKDTYNKNKRSRKVGTGSATRKKPSKWQLSDILSFLDVATYEREGVSNIISSDASAIEHTNEDPQIQSQKNTDGLFEDSIDASVLNQGESELQPSSSAIGESISETGVTRKIKKSWTESVSNKKTKKNDNLLDALKKRDEERNKILQELKNIEQDDPIDAFFTSMALTVKQFTPELIIQAKFDILRIVSNLELKNNKLKEIMPPPQVPQPSTSSSYEFPTTVNPYQSSEESSHPEWVDYNYSTSNSFDSQQQDSEQPEEYWIHSLNK